MCNLVNLGPDVDLVALTQAAYARSRPVGMGFLHYRPGDLALEEAQAIVARGGTHAFGPAGAPNVLSLDYVLGRAVKLNVWRDREGVYYTTAAWYDHTAAEFDDLLATCGLAATPRPKKKET